MYTDREFFEIVRGQPARYVYFPILLTLGTGLLWPFASSAVHSYVYLGFWAWQAFHYGRQNVGLYSFVSIAQNMKPAPKPERIAIELGAVCGILATLRVLGAGVSPPYLHTALIRLYQLGGVGLVVVAAFGIALYARNLRHRNAIEAVFFFTLMLFFAPAYLSSDVNVAFFSYATAHGLQYIAFMSVVSVNSGPDTHPTAFRYRGAATLFLLTVIGGFIFIRTVNPGHAELIQGSTVIAQALRFAVGATLGLTMAHFVIDAGAWRLSQRPQRAYMTKRFGFVFNPRRSLTAAAGS